MSDRMQIKAGRHSCRTFRTLLVLFLSVAVAILGLVMPSVLMDRLKEDMISGSAEIRRNRLGRAGSKADPSLEALSFEQIYQILHMDEPEYYLRGYGLEGMSEEETELLLGACIHAVNGGMYRGLTRQVMHEPLENELGYEDVIVLVRNTYAAFVEAGIVPDGLADLDSAQYNAVLATSQLIPDYEKGLPPDENLGLWLVHVVNNDLELELVVSAASGQILQADGYMLDQLTEYWHQLVETENPASGAAGGPYHTAVPVPENLQASDGEEQQDVLQQFDIHKASHAYLRYLGFEDRDDIRISDMYQDANAKMEVLVAKTEDNGEETTMVLIMHLTADHFGFELQ